MKTTSYEHVQRLLVRPPRVRASQTSNKGSSSKCRSNVFLLFYAEHFVATTTKLRELLHVSDSYEQVVEQQYVTQEALLTLNWILRTEGVSSWGANVQLLLHEPVAIVAEESFVEQYINVASIVGGERWKLSVKRLCQLRL